MTSRSKLIQLMNVSSAKIEGHSAEGPSKLKIRRSTVGFSNSYGLWISDVSRQMSARIQRLNGIEWRCMHGESYYHDAQQHLVGFDDVKVIGSSFLKSAILRYDRKRPTTKATAIRPESRERRRPTDALKNPLF
jgi:hypothetical protein